MYVYYTYQIPSKCIISAKIEPLKFRSYLLNLSFFSPLQLKKINSTESYDFFLARIYRARIQSILLIREAFNILRRKVIVSRLTGFRI